MPRYHSSVSIAAAQAFYHASSPSSPLEVRAVSPASSLLASCFNSCWALARNEWEAGRCDAFAMIHSDVSAPLHWLDVLYREMEKTGVDLISCVIPIKDGRGLTSTVVDDTGDPWRRRRLTMREVAALPETFTDKDVGGPLLLNTGLWLCKLGPWCLEALFETKDHLRRGPDGLWQACCLPEDWGFSLQARALGLKLAATRSVRVEHYGEQKWSNQEVWGWDHDLQNSPQSMAEGWQFPEDVEGWLTAEEGMALAEAARGREVLEIGSYCGRSTICLAQTATAVHCVDTFDGRDTPHPHPTWGDFLANVNRYGVAGKVVPHRGTAAQMIPPLGRRFGMAFIDGAHDRASVMSDARLATAALEPGGLLAFHDYHSPRDPGVTDAVNSILASGARLVRTAGTVALVQPA